ncbi:MAG: uracil-DNA glycosylase [Alphaproteobacteria bacterium]|nr:uracil-DNA glycosylase [Alphaproteobacteria bacterium]
MRTDFENAIKVLKWFADAGVSDVSSEDALSPSIVENDVRSLEDLKRVMETVDTPLKYCAQNMVFGVGNIEAEILFLGEAPGAEEDKQGIPFVGQSGQLLDKALAAIGLDREAVYITNILPWRPPGNRTPSTQEIALFRPLVLKHISFINPRIVVCLGGTAAKALLQSSDGIMRLRGRFTSVEGIAAKILPTFHPAYLLRSPSQKREFWHDFLAIQNEIESDGIYSDCSTNVVQLS